MKNLELSGFFNPSFSSSSFIIPLFRRRNSNFTYVQSLGDGFAIENFVEYDCSNFQVLFHSDSMPSVSRSVGEPGILGLLGSNGDLFFGTKETLAEQLMARVDQFENHPFLYLEIARFIDNSGLIRKTLQESAQLFSSKELQESWINREERVTEKLRNRKPNPADARYPPAVNQEGIVDIDKLDYTKSIEWLTSAAYSESNWAKIWLRAYQLAKRNSWLLSIGASWLSEYSISGNFDDWNRIARIIAKFGDTLQLSRAMSHAVLSDQLAIEHYKVALVIMAQHPTQAEIHQVSITLIEKRDKISRSEAKNLTKLLKNVSKHSENPDLLAEPLLRKLHDFDISPFLWYGIWQILTSFNFRTELISRLTNEWLSFYLNRLSRSESTNIPTKPWASVWLALQNINADNHDFYRMGLKFLENSNRLSNGWPRICSALINQKSPHSDKALEFAMEWLGSFQTTSWSALWLTVANKLGTDSALYEIGAKWRDEHPSKTTNWAMIDHVLQKMQTLR